MTHIEVVHIVAERLGLSQRKAHDLVEVTVRAIAETLGGYVGISIPDLGTFGSHVRPQRRAYSPYYEDLVLLPSKRAVFFHPSASLKADVRNVEIAG
ncbi:MAG: HU family DNA-binding protein [Candidatus Neomarinimicrobiota bacterium]